MSAYHVLPSSFSSARTEVSECLDLLGNGKTALVVDHGAFGLVGLFFFICLFAQIALERDEDEFDAGAVLGNLGNPFGFDVLEGVGGVDL